MLWYNNYMFRVLKSTLFSLFILCSFFTAVSAQGIPGIKEPVTFQVSPQFPKPNTDVSVSAQSYSTDLDRAEFTWYVNGKLFRKGFGIPTITLPSGKSGSETTVSVTVATSDIGNIKNEVVIKPSDVSLVWKSDGYTPPFYKGKPLELYGSSFTVVAIPEFFNTSGKRIDPSTLVYTWEKNGDVDGSQSGYGKSSFTEKQTSYVRGGDDISVTVSTITHDQGAVGSVTISPTASDIVFYENSPLYGIIYEKALMDTFNLENEELAIHAELFNISTKNPLSGTVSYDWLLNDAPITTFKDKNEIVLRKTGIQNGQSNISLNIQHLDRLLQGGGNSITILQ